jgi:hypothetical protein
MKKKSRQKRFLFNKNQAGVNRPAVFRPQNEIHDGQKIPTSNDDRRPTNNFLDTATSRYLQTTYGNRAVLRHRKSAQPDPHRISRPGDSGEQQAARVADRIVQSTDDGTARANTRTALSSAPELQLQPSAPLAAEQQNTAAAQSASRPPKYAANDSGVPLNDSSRAFFEPRFGQDFSRVRIHHDARAATAAAGLNARAFTTGDDIYFGRDEYAPGTGTGRKLLAHELTHVVQQRRGVAPPVIQREAAAASPEQQAAALLTGAANLLSASPPHAPLPGIRQLMQESGNVIANFFPSGYGVMDSNGRVTSGSTRTDLYTTVRSGSTGVGMPFEFRVYAYLSHETGGTAAGRYVRMGNLGGRIIFFINHLTGVSVEEVAELMAHELFHMWAHAQRVMRERFGDEAAGQLPTRAAARILDPGRFSAHRRTMQTHFTTLIGYLDAEQRRRGVLLLGRSVSERADRWADLVVEEVSAYVYGVCAREAITTEHTRRTAASTGAPAVGIGSFFNAVPFLRSYIRDHWLQDPADRTALDQPRGRSLLTGMRDDILALKSAVESHIGCRR